MSDQLPQKIEALRSAVYPSFAMLAGMQLDLFTALVGGPLSAGQLAAATDTDASRLGVLLYALVNAGLLTVDGEERFANTEESAGFLVRGREGSMLERHHLWSELWRALGHTADSIRDGRPHARKDFASMSASELRSFFSGLHPNAMAEGREYASWFDAADNPVIDVAGGSGGFAIGLMEALPQLEVTVVDLPEVTPHTRYFIDQADAAGRISVVSADVVEGSLQGDFGAAMLRNFIQVLAPDQIVRALACVVTALRPGAIIYISGHILDNSRQSPVDSVAFNLVFVNIYDAGQAYTEMEYRHWLSEAGFVGIERLGEDLMRARRPG